MAAPADFNPNRGIVLFEGPMISLTPAKTVVRRHGGKPDRPSKAVPTCRDEVLAVLTGLTERTGNDVFTGGEVHAEMAGAGTRYSKSTVLKTMQRMKTAPSRPPYFRLKRVGTSGFRLTDGS